MEKKNNYYIYFHINPVKNEIFYVGKGKNDRAYVRSKRNNWWNRIVSKYGLIIDIVENNLTEDEAFQREIFYISKIGRRILGEGPLINFHKGGNGGDESKRGKHNHYGENNPMFGRKQKDSTKNKIREKASGKKQSQECIEKRVKKIKGLKRSPESCERIGLIRRGKKNTPEHIEKVKEGLRLIKHGQMGNNIKAIPIEYKGKKYSCLKELYNDLFKDNVSYSYFIANMDKILRDGKAESNTKYKPIEYKGKKYSCLKELYNDLFKDDFSYTHFIRNRDKILSL